MTLISILSKGILTIVFLLIFTSFNSYAAAELIIDGPTELNISQEREYKLIINPLGDILSALKIVLEYDPSLVAVKVGKSSDTPFGNGIFLSKVDAGSGRIYIETATNQITNVSNKGVVAYVKLKNTATSNSKMKLSLGDSSFFMNALTNTKTKLISNQIEITLLSKDSKSTSKSTSLISTSKSTQSTTSKSVSSTGSSSKSTSTTSQSTTTSSKTKSVSSSQTASESSSSDSISSDNTISHSSDSSVSDSSTTSGSNPIFPNSTDENDLAEIIYPDSGIYNSDYVYNNQKIEATTQPQNNSVLITIISLVISVALIFFVYKYYIKKNIFK